MQETILVTGAHGFLGRHVARCAAEQGYTVVGIGHGNWQREEWSLWGLSQWHRGDVSLDSLCQYVGSPEAILHCAGSGSVPFSLADPWEDMQRTVLTTASVLEFIRKRSPTTRLVYPSSAGVYGIASRFPISEDMPCEPISPYGTHKRMAEELIASRARSFSLQASVIRYFSIFGVGLRKQFLWDACGKIARNDLIFTGTGDEVRDWLHVDDAALLLVTGIRFASTECPVVNGGTGVGTSVRDLLRHLAGGLGLREVNPSFNGASRIGDPTCYIADIERARAWGWEPSRNWMERVDEYVLWWQNETGLHRPTQKTEA